MTATARRNQVRNAAMAIPLLFLVLVPVQRRIEPRVDLLQSETADTLFATGPMLSKLSLGYGSLLADIYWTRVVQYYGQRVGRANANYDLLAPLLDITTTLDPQLIIAYRFGGTFLAESRPIGAGRPDLGVKLVRRGIAANPKDWQLYSDLGTIYYWHMHNYEAAAQTFWQGGDIAGAPPWMKSFAAHIAEKGLSSDTSRFMWAEVYRSSSDARIRRNAMNHLKELQAEDDLSALAQIVEAYKKKFGHYPTSGEELVAAGMARSTPKDPEGYAYQLGPDGKPGLDPASPITKLLEDFRLSQ